MKRKNAAPTCSRGSLHAVLTAFVATLLALPAHAAIEIPRTPPMSGNGVPPNILFILDDSGSMVFEAMPRDTYSLQDTIWDKSYVHNTIYYNPFKEGGYKTWSTPTGGRMSGGDRYDGAYADLSRVGGDTIDLMDDDDCEWVDQNGGNLKVCGGTQTFFVPKDPENDSADYLSQNKNFYRYMILGEEWGQSEGRIARCEWKNGSWYGSNYKNCEYATPTDRSEAEERENYAIWFSYHRTRMKVAKAGATMAFSGLDGEKFRVGFTTIWGPKGSGADNDEFLIPVEDDNGLFRGDNREDWFDTLLDARGYNGTPLLPALDRAGKYFSDDDDDGPYGGNVDDDGNQFQCRQNFSILTTDGYWNSGSADVGNADNKDGKKYVPPDPNPDDDLDPVPYGYEAEMPYAGSDSVTLADVAAYYWKRDLRTDMDNIVPSSVANPAFWQHMVTFGISIGLSGTLDQSSVKEVLEKGGISRNGTSLSDWPDPTDKEDGEKIDDLLHAAVNGHGEFVAATDADAFGEALEAALAAITERTSSSSNVAANSSSLSTDTRLYAASYVGGQWTGELKALEIDSKKQAVNDPPVWTASAGMPSNIGNRKIYTYDGGDGVAFKYNNLSNALKAKFAAPVVGNFGSTANLAQARVEYLRGSDEHERSNEGPFRNRARSGNRAPLGDIIHSSPFYLQSEAQDGTNAIFVGANDGMLHAFDAATGEELFAYVPAGTDWTDMVDLTSPDYAHSYFVDGPIVVSPRSMASGRNILVGALGRGGKGVFGLDVTDPSGFDDDDVEWDTSTQGDADADMGHVLSRPFIAPLNNGKTGVIFGNGINSASGKAVLYVVDLLTGEVLSKIDTGVGGDNALSGTTGWDSDGDGVVDEVYAGDLKGNLWKFDLSDKSAGKWDVAFKDGKNPAPMLVATDSAGNRQAITGAPSLALDPKTYNTWVVFGTGRLFNDDDLWNADGSSNLAVNSVYGVKVPTSGPLGMRSAIDDTTNGLQVRHIELAGVSADNQAIRGFEVNGALDTGKQGWVLDLLTPPKPGTAEGERVVGDSQVIDGAFVFSSIIPSTDPCTPGGRSFLNAIHAFTGSSVPSYFFDLDGDGSHTDNDDIGGGTGNNSDGPQRPVGSVDAGTGLATTPTIMDKVVCVNGSTGTTECKPTSGGGMSGRISWREIIGD